MSALDTFGENIIPFRTESVHVSWLMNSATKHIGVQESTEQRKQRMIPRKQTHKFIKPEMTTAYRFLGQGLSRISRLTLKALSRGCDLGL